MKVEISHHKQVAIVQKTPVFYHGRGFVPAHFSLETMMAGKMLACIERNFQHGKESYSVKSAMEVLREKAASIKIADLSADLIPMFESHGYISSWLDAFHKNFERYAAHYR